MNKYLFFCCLFFLVSCKSKKTDSLIIAAAASTQFAVEELIKEFKKHSDVEIDLITASSGKLTAQIVNGAPYDIFISADTFYPNEILKAKKGLKDVQIYGAGIPVLWTMNENIDLSQPEIFSKSDVMNIAIADPQNAPYGKSALRFLSMQKDYDQFKSKLVYGESISQVNEYVTNGHVQIGISAKSVIMASQLKEKGYMQDLDSSYYIHQALIPIKNKKVALDKLKLEFTEFVLSDKGKKILNTFGFDTIL